MIIDVLGRLDAPDVPMRESTYVGFGSVYFVDFVMMHKMLGIRRMITVEHDIGIRRRVRFNRPYRFVRPLFMESGTAITRLSASRSYVVWLDYDQRLSDSMLGDVDLACRKLRPGSALLVTVDVEAPKRGGPTKWRDETLKIAGSFGDHELPSSAFGRSRLGRRVAEILNRVITSAVAEAGCSFAPLFDFEYSDTHRMLTIGGVVAQSAQLERISGSGVRKLRFVRSIIGSATPFRIRVPGITRKERHYLDSFMPCARTWKPKDFDLSRDDIRRYREVYKYFPPYAELAL